MRYDPALEYGLGGYVEIPDASDPVLIVTVTEGDLDVTALYVCVVTAGEFGGAAGYTLKERAETAKVMVTGVTVAGEKETIAVGESLQLTASVLPENAADVTIAWSSSDEAVAAVDENGVVTGLLEGHAVITAAANDGSGISGTFEITVDIAQTNERALMDVETSGACGDNLTWNYDEATGTLTISGTGDMYDCRYSDSAPWHDFKLNTLVICPGITSIGNRAFEECSGFSGELIVPEGVTKIGYCAFQGCSGFSGKLKLPDSVLIIGDNAFYGCRGFTGELLIPDAVTSIGGGAFQGCRGLTGDLTIPNSVTSLGAGAFYGCSGITGSLVLPENLTSIESGTFAYCKFTGSLILPSSVTSIDSYAFYDCSGFTGKLKIPYGVTTISYNAFQDCTGFNGKLEIPDSVTEIGYEAFLNCAGFEGNLIIPGSVANLEEGVFCRCSSLTSITLSDGTKNVSRIAFANCLKLTSIFIPDSVTHIDSYAFDGCSNLTDIYYGGTQEQWVSFKVWIPTANTTVHYNCLDINQGRIDDVKSGNMSVLVMENTQQTDSESEKYVASDGAEIFEGNVSLGKTDDSGQLTINSPSSPITIKKEGYVTRTITPQQLGKSSTVYLQKEGEYPTITALWYKNSLWANDEYENTDILHSEVQLHIWDDNVLTVTPEIDWGKGRASEINLYQDGRKLILSEGDNTVPFGEKFDLAKPIYLVAKNTAGLASKKQLKFKVSSGDLDGFEFNFGDGMSFDLPESMLKKFPFLPKSLSFGVDSLMPVQFVEENGKIYGSIGLKIDASESFNKGDKIKKTEIKSFVGSVKDLRNSVSNAKDAVDAYKTVRNAMKIHFYGLYRGI